ncbi:MAG: CRTAC1 family protein [Fuerstiella sp.]|nr:CRTAC1 family protein [Fuerstiella sp.]
MSVAVTLMLIGSGCQDAAGPTTTPSQTVSVPVPAPAPSLTDGLLTPDGARPDNHPAPTSSVIRFEETAYKVGIDFVYDNGYSEKRLMPAATSGGCGWIDIDHDGWWDLYLVQGGDMQAVDWSSQPHDQLFRNRRGQQFQNATASTGVVDTGYGHGVTIADLDNDGFDDIYISTVGSDVLYRNLGDGTFQNSTRAAGMSNSKWAASAAWGDLDADGNLDLYVCNYVDYDPHNPIACIGEEGQPVTCHPRDVSDVPNVCFMNQGDLTFVEAADSRGLNGPGSKSLGVVIADFDRDSDADVYVANDTERNHLFVNGGDGNFTESGTARGCAMSGLGHHQASMGVAFGDYDRNESPDLYVTHFIDDSNTMYQNLGMAAFTDATRDTALHHPTLPHLAFGTVMADFDSNGWLDLFVSNGHIDDWRSQTGAPWKMTAQVFQYDGRQWHEASADAGDYFKSEWLGRGVASCDFDNDGDMDLAVLHQNDRLALLENESPQGHWLRIQFIGNVSNRNGIGVEVIVKQGELKLVQQMAGGTSYCSSHQMNLFFGLAQSPEPCELTIRWPSGHQQTFARLSLDQPYVLSEKHGLVEL